MGQVFAFEIPEKCSWCKYYYNSMCLSEQCIKETIGGLNMAVNTHIINVAFDFDDDAIKKRLEDTIEEKIINGIKHDLTQTLYKRLNSWNSHGFGESMPDKEKYAEVMEKYMRDAVEAVIETHKDAIIDLAADKLVDKIYRTKKFKEKIDAAIDGNQD